jgi:hypothetical protein
MINRSRLLFFLLTPLICQHHQWCTTAETMLNQQLINFEQLHLEHQLTHATICQKYETKLAALQKHLQLLNTQLENFELTPPTDTATKT